MKMQSTVSEYVVKQKLSEEEISFIKAIEQANQQQKRIYYKIDPQGLVSAHPRTKHILTYNNGLFSGYAYINGFDGENIECTILSTGPRIDLNKFYEIILNLAKSGTSGTKKITFVSDKNDFDFIDFAESLGFQYSFSEHRMFLENDKFVFHDSNMITLHHATIDDAKSILDLDEVFTADEPMQAQFNKDDILATKIAKQGNEVVGKVRIDKVDDIAGIYGFVVQPKLRGKGFGRNILNLAVNECLITGFKTVFLEVESENSPALHLYESVGFKIRSTFHYMERTL